MQHAENDTSKSCKRNFVETMIRGTQGVKIASEAVLVPL